MNETPEQYIQRIRGYIEGRKPMSILTTTTGKLERLLRHASARQLKAKPQPDKWSAAEILAHLADTEIVFGFRLRLVFGMNAVPVQAFDQDVWARYSDYPNQDPKLSFQTLKALRTYNLRLLKTVPKELWDNFGMHTERGKEGISRMMEMFAGHDLNHLRQLEQLLKRK